MWTPYRADAVQALSERPFAYCFLSTSDPGAPGSPATELSPSYWTVVLAVPDSRLRRVLAWLAMPFRAALAQRRMRRRGIVPAGRFGFYPSLEQPTLVYELEAPASTYSESHLLPGDPPSALEVLTRRGVRAWTGCHPSLAAVVLIGRQP